MALRRLSRLSVIDESVATLDVLTAARIHQADVVIMNIEQAFEVPPSVTLLLAGLPEILVVGIISGEDRAQIYEAGTHARTLTDLSLTGIVRAIERD
jgi:hypothetical protein